MLDIGVTWLAIIGALVFALAVAAWYGGGNKSYATWIGFLGVVILAAGLALHVQKIAGEAKPNRPSDVEIAQSRAYVSITSILQGPHIENGQHLGWLIAVQWINRGQTPARNSAI